MQAAVETWIHPTATADFQLQQAGGAHVNACPSSAAPTGEQPAAGGLSGPLLQTAGMVAPALTPTADDVLQDASLPTGPVERQGSLADLLFEILDDGDTDDLLLADLNKASDTEVEAGVQLLLAAQQQPAPLLQQLQQRRLLERLQASKQEQQQGELDLFAIRDPSNATSSSLAPSAAGTAGSTPWPSFTSAPGQPGPGAAGLFGTDPAAAAAGAAGVRDAGAALMQQLQLRAQGLPTSLPALKVAAGVAEGALLERQAMKKQLLQQIQQRQQQRQDSLTGAAADTAAAAAGADQQQQPQQQQQGAGQQEQLLQQQQQPQQQQQEGEAMQIEAAPAADAAAAGAVADAAGAGGNCSAATAAALLAEAGDDLNLDLDFLESMLQDTNGGGDFKVLGDLARMVSLPVTGDVSGSPLLAYQQPQQSGPGAGCTSLAEDMDRAGLMQPPPPQLQQQQGALDAAAAGAGQLGRDGMGAGVPGGMQADPSPSMDSGMRSAMNRLGRLQIPSPSPGDLGLASGLQHPMSVDAARPGGLDQGGRAGLLPLSSGAAQNPLSRQFQLDQGLGAGGVLGVPGAAAKPPLPASSSRSGVGPSSSLPDESNGSVELGAAEAMSDGEVEQAASGRRTSARRRALVAKHKRQQKAAQAAAAAAAATAAAAKVQSGVPPPQTPGTTQPQVVPGGMLQLLLNGSSNGLDAAAPGQVQGMDLMQQPQQQQMGAQLQSYGSAPNPGRDGPLSHAGMLATAASAGHLGLASPAGSSLSADPIQTIPRKQLTAVLATLAPNALQQLLMLQQRQPALARVVLKRALQQLQHQTELGVQHQGLESLLGGLGSTPDAAGVGGQLASPTPSAAAAAGVPTVFKPRQSSSKGAAAGEPLASSQSRRNKAPLVFYRQRGSKTMTNMGGKDGSCSDRGQQQTQRAGSTPLPEGSCKQQQQQQDLLSPQAPSCVGTGFGLDDHHQQQQQQQQQFDTSMAAALNGQAGGAAAAGAVSGDGGAQAGAGSMSSSDMASSDGGGPPQQPSGGSHRGRLGKRGRQVTQIDLSGAVAAANGGPGGGGGSNPLDGAGAGAGALTTPQSSGALPYLPMQQQTQLQMQLQHGLTEAMGLGMDPSVAAAAAAAQPPRAEQQSGSGAVGGGGSLAALFGQNASTATGSASSAGVAADAAVITQQARALVRILTKLNTQQLIQTRTMLHSVLQRSAPGLLDHMGAIERMITQLINLKQQQPLLPQQQQQQLLMQGAFGAGGSMFAAGGGGAGGLNMGFAPEDPLVGGQQQQQQQQQQQRQQQQQQQQQQLQQLQGSGMLHQQQQHMVSWPNDPFVQHQMQQPQGLTQQQLLQSQMQAQLQQQSPWGIATSLSGPQPLQWNAQASMLQQQPDGSAAGAAAAAAIGAGAAPAGGAGPDDDTDQTPYQLATRRQQGRRTKAKPDKQRQRQQQQQQQAAAAPAAAAGLQMAASAPASIPQSVIGANPVVLQQQQQQQQLGAMAEMQQQQQRIQQLQQLRLQQQQQRGMALGSSEALLLQQPLPPQQQQQVGGQMQRDTLGAPGSGAGDGLLLDAANEHQQEDMLMSWLQADEGWPEGQDMLGVMSG